MPISLATGSVVQVAPPVLPVIAVAPPVTPSVHVVAVAGPPGAKGDPGNSDVTALTAAVAANQVAVAALQAQPRGWVHTQSAPTLLVQIVHGLPFVPAGVRCVDPQGITEPAAITTPATGVTEVAFGSPFTGTVYLS